MLDICRANVISSAPPSFEATTGYAFRKIYLELFDTSVASYQPSAKLISQECAKPTNFQASKLRSRQVYLPHRSCKIGGDFLRGVADVDANAPSTPCGFQKHWVASRGSFFSCFLF